jgi:hypothetical protein
VAKPEDAVQGHNKYTTGHHESLSEFKTFFFVWFVRLLALRPLLASGDSEDNCGEVDGM